MSRELFLLLCGLVVVLTGESQAKVQVYHLERYV